MDEVELANAPLLGMNCPECGSESLVNPTRPYCNSCRWEYLSPIEIIYNCYMGLLDNVEEWGESDGW